MNAAAASAQLAVSLTINELPYFLANQLLAEKRHHQAFQIDIGYSFPRLDSFSLLPHQWKHSHDVPLRAEVRARLTVTNTKLTEGADFLYHLMTREAQHKTGR